MEPPSEHNDREPVMVYLDQNHWITMARARVSRHKVKSADELAAADALGQAASAGSVRLPLSTAHLVETGRRGVRQNRVELAETMLAAYSGWHMRSPLDVRFAELLWGLSGQHGAPLNRHDVFGQRPGAPFTAESYTPYVCDDPSLNPDQQRMIEQLAWASTWRELMLSDTPTEQERDSSDAMVSGWLATNRDIAEYMANNPASRDKRLVAAMLMYSDLIKDIARASMLLGMAPSEMSERIGGQHSATPDQLDPDIYIAFFTAMPFVGRMMEIIHQRIRNPDEKWVRGDLNDIMYLSCAAGYADIVVAENATVHRLTTGAKNTTPGAAVFNDLHGLHLHLLKTGVLTT
jgi:hypothetical protein